MNKSFIPHIDFNNYLFIKKETIHSIAYAVLAVIISAWFCKIRWIFSYQYEPANLNHLLDYTARVPFQYRILVPFLVNQLYKVELVGCLFGNKESLVFFLDVLFLASVLLVTKKILIQSGLEQTFSKIFAFFILAPVTFCLVLVPGRNLYYPYDLSSLFFFSLCLWFLYENKYLVFYLIFIVATFNRETSCFLSIVFLLTQYKTLSKGKLAGHLILQLIIWVLIKLLLVKLFQNNVRESSVNALFVYQFFYNVDMFKNPWNVVHILGANAFFWLPVLIFYKKIKNDFVSKALWVIPIIYIGMLVVGVLTELRIFTEISIILTLALGHVIQNSIKGN